jgi:hypothetical protein
VQNITTSVELKEAIQLLEVEQELRGQLLKEQFFITYESFKPVNLIRNALKSAVNSPNLINNILGSVVGLASGYLSNKVVVGASANIFRRLFGSLVQMGVSNLVAQHPEDIKSIGLNILHRIFAKKEVHSENL